MNAHPASASPAEVPPSIWERMAQPSPAPTLTHARIAEAALKIADIEGITAVSMRRLAAELGVSAMTCYRYVSGKDDVLELMLDTVRQEMLLKRPIGTWKQVLRASALQFRREILRHPWMSDIPGRILFAPTPGFLAVTEQNLAALDGLGLQLDQMADVTSAVTAYTRASTHDEITRARLLAPEGWTTGRDARDANLTRLTWLLSAGDYPLYERVALHGTPRTDDQARFEFGLDCLLEGIGCRLKINGDDAPVDGDSPG